MVLMATNTVIIILYLTGKKATNEFDENITMNM